MLKRMEHATGLTAKRERRVRHPRKSPQQAVSSREATRDAWSVGTGGSAGLPGLRLMSKRMQEIVAGLDRGQLQHDADVSFFELVSAS